MQSNRAQRRAQASATGQKAERIFISRAKVIAGPPPPHQKWNFGSIAALLRSVGIDVSEVINWTKAPDNIGYFVFYIGEAASEKKQLSLH